MHGPFATDFSGIIPTLQNNPTLRQQVSDLIPTDNIFGKITEGGDRLDQFRAILIKLVDGHISFTDAILLTEQHLSRQGSPHSQNNQVFSRGWASRLVRTQLSRFYNQGVLTLLLKEGIDQCYVPSSPTSKKSSLCAQQLEGKNHSTKEMLGLLTDSYRDGNFDNKAPKVPHHPHCSHVVTPPDN